MINVTDSDAIKNAGIDIDTRIGAVLITYLQCTHYEWQIHMILRCIV